MKFVAILSLALALSVAGDTVPACPAYVCDPSSAKWPSKACGMVDPTTTTQYDIRSDYCSSDSTCPYTTSPAYCATNPTSVQIAYPGEPCDDTHTCFGPACVNKLCPVLSVGTTCKNVYDCGGSNTCPQYGTNALKCTAVIAAGSSGCYQDSDCAQNAGCVGAQMAPNLTVGNCVEYRSIAPQKAAESCTATTTTHVANSYCQSGFCYQSTANTSLCTDNVKSTGTTPATCTSGIKCASTNDSGSGTPLNLECECGLDGIYYCPLFPGDQLWTDSFTNQWDYINSSTSLKKCNSVRNNSANPPYPARDYCDQNTSGVSKSVYYSYFMAMSYASYVKADKCAIKAFYRDYYDYEDAASWVALSGLVLALIY